jgi:hypothetical protein
MMCTRAAMVRSLARWTTSGTVTIHPGGAERGADPDTAVHHHARLDLDAAPRF